MRILAFLGSLRAIGITDTAIQRCGSAVHQSSQPYVVLVSHSTNLEPKVHLLFCPKEATHLYAFFLCAVKGPTPLLIVSDNLIGHSRFRAEPVYYLPFGLLLHNNAHTSLTLIACLTLMACLERVMTGRKIMEQSTSYPTRDVGIKSIYLMPQTHRALLQQAYQVSTLHPRPFRS